MAKWGSPWGAGFPWGGVGGGAAFLCALANDRILVQMDDTPGNRNFRDLMCALVEGFGDYIDTAEDVAAGFDLTTAIGAQLDVIGRIVGLPREGYGDARYRTLLGIQIELILSSRRGQAEWTGTVENILRICREFVGPGAPIVYQAAPPYDFVLSVPGLAIADAPLLFRFLRTALYAGVLGQVINVLDPDSLWNSASVAVTGGGIWGSASVAVPGEAIWSTTLPIGV